ncbi:MAG: hypothetical protein D3903_06320 [Candidatus Electrothrix sp. GM3_4]|nr:hypothetical protein [Candidatus Electrothrix sp. GM3_4]
MEKYYFVASKGLLAVCTNDRKFKWPYGTDMPYATQKEYEDCIVRIQLDIVDNISPSRAGETKWCDLSEKYHYFSGITGKDILRYRRDFLFGSELQIEIKGLLTDEPHLIVNRHYYKYITHKFMNLHSIGYILDDIAGLIMLRKGFAPVYCSSFKYGSDSVVIFAAPNTGKTLSTLVCCTEHNAGFIAEDLALTDGTMIYSVPWTNSFRYYSKVGQSRLSKIFSYVSRVFPSLDLIFFRKKRNINNKLFSKINFIESARVTHIAILEKCSGGLFQSNIKEISHKVMNLHKYRFNCQRSPLIIAYNYFNPDLKIDNIYETEKNIVCQLIKNAQEHFIVKENNAASYANLLLTSLKKR